MGTLIMALILSLSMNFYMIALTDRVYPSLAVPHDETPFGMTLLMILGS